MGTMYEDQDEDWFMVDNADIGVPEDPDMEMRSLESFEMLSQSQSQDAGKGRLVELEIEKEKPFPIMNLPTEIRLEIYRACLTRPYKVMLSKVEKPPEQVETAIREDVELVWEDGDSTHEGGPSAFEAYHQKRADRGMAPTSHGNDNQSHTISSHTSRSRRVPMANRWRTWAPRTPRSNRSLIARPSSASRASNMTVFTSNNQSVSSSNPVVETKQSTSRLTAPPIKKRKPAQDTKPKSEDPLLVNILRTSKEIYKEARDVLYSENIFDLDISTAVTSLAALHQRSRRHIKHVELEIPTYTEILERFSEVVRLSLRYCSGLKNFVIHTPFTLPGADGSMSASNTTVYANGFDILRWLPQGCEVLLHGNQNVEIEAVVRKHLDLAKTQDKVSFASYVHLPQPWMHPGPLQ